jgi:acyl-CoA synthetase (NDP forming)
MQSQPFSLDEIFAPRGVAVVGASARKLGFAEMVLASLKQADFPAIYPVNPKYSEVQGLRCYPSVSAVEGPVDHVVVNIPAESVLSLLDDCTVKGVRSVHFFTAGFGESGYADKADLERQILKKAQAGGYRVIGPNCIGLFVPKTRLVNDLAVPLDPGPVGFLSQSGGHAQNLPGFSATRGLRFSKVVSYGNALDIDESELLDYFVGDPETEIITAYIEGVKDGPRFNRALASAAAVKPVIVYKGGRSEAGQRAAHGHTASMTSSIDVFDALCRQHNAIIVRDIEEMIDVTVGLRFIARLPDGPNVALVGAGGGPSVLAGDEMEQEGLRLPPFSGDVQEALKAVLPIAGSIFGNPLDTPNMASPEAIAAAFKILGTVPEIDMIVYHLGFHPISRWGMGLFSGEAHLQSVVETMRKCTTDCRKPVLLVLRPPQEIEGMKAFLQAQQGFVEAGLPVFHSMKHLARAVSRLIIWQHRSQHTAG